MILGLSVTSAGTRVIRPVTVGLIWMVGLESTVGALIADNTPPLIDRRMVEIVEVQTVKFSLVVRAKTGAQTLMND